MSKHARARSRPARTNRRAARRAALAATVGLVAFTAGWVYVAQDPDQAAGVAQARTDSRPQPVDRVARDTLRSPMQGLTGISEQTRARIPAESRQLILVTGRAVDSSESTA
ncbi:hypothetical protein ACFXAL_13315, partial [Streptomyces amritsarensis]